MISRSLIFGIVDEEPRYKAIKEIKFSLPGLAESEGLEIGEVELVDYFLAGQVTELGEDFRLTLNLIEVETGTVTNTVDGRIHKKEFFETTAAFIAAYVSP